MRHAPSGLQRAAHISQARHRIGKEHRAKPRKDEVELIRWQRDFGISAQEADVLQSARADLGPSVVKEGIAAVDADHASGRADAGGKLQRGVTKAASDIQHVVAVMHRKRRKNRFAMMRKSIDQYVLESDKFRCEYVIPEADKSCVFDRRGRCSRGIHELSFRSVAI